MSRLTLIQGREKLTAEFTEGTNLLKAIRECGFVIQAPCGGNGTCGKCQVVLTDRAGTRLAAACRAKIQGECTVKIPEFHLSEKDGLKSENALQRGKAEDYLAAVDLGTTTIVTRVFDGNNGRLLGESAAWNAQVSYGADVISRVRYIMDHANGLETLQKAVREQIKSEICRAAADTDAFEKCSGLVVAGNTIMQHIFAGIDPTSIAKAPFLPQSYFLEESRKMTRLLPCVSGYVGGDIVAGLFALELDKKEETALFLDIGTNGEMVLCSPKGLICCSVATGPAFEGAEISCGMLAVPGAVRHLKEKDGKLLPDTVGGVPPVGICGSGLIELLAILLNEEVVDETGRLLPPEEAPARWAVQMEADENENGVFFLTEDKSVSLTARDVRKLQLAKAAVAAGIQALLEQSGLNESNVERVYLAGSFGAHLNVDSAVAIGLLPKGFRNKVVAVGNASLDGAEKLLFSPGEWPRLVALQKNCRYLELSTWPRFNELYIDNMYF